MRRLTTSSTTVAAKRRGGEAIRPSPLAGGARLAQPHGPVRCGATSLPPAPVRRGRRCGSRGGRVEKSPSIGRPESGLTMKRGAVAAAPRPPRSQMGDAARDLVQRRGEPQGLAADLGAEPVRRILARAGDRHLDQRPQRGERRGRAAVSQRCWAGRARRRTSGRG